MRRVPGVGLAGLPMPLADEVGRPRLLDRLDARWQHPVTVVQAGAGFGKSTLLAQAVPGQRRRAPRHRRVAHLHARRRRRRRPRAGAARRARRAEPLRTTPPPRSPRRVAAYSPIDVCIVLDDAHEARPGSSGAELIDRLLRRLPDNGHLVLAARHAPPVRLSRLRAADRLVEITQDDLLFTPRRDRRRWRSRLGRDPAAADRVRRLARARAPRTGGPAGGRHRLRAGGGAGQRHRRATSRPVRAVEPRLRRPRAASPGSSASASTSTSLAARRAARLPHRGRPVPGPRSVDRSAAARAARRRGRRPPHARRSTSSSRAGTWLAPAPWRMAHDDVDALAHIATEVVRRTIAALPIDMVQPWVDVLERARPDAARDASRARRAAPGARLHRSTRRRRRRRRGGGLPRSRRSGRRDRGDRRRHGRLVHARRRRQARRRSPAEPTPSRARVTTRRSTWRCASIAAIGAEMRGDLDRRPRTAARRAARPGAPPIRSSVSRLHVHCLLLSGRADEAVEVTRQLLAVSADRATRYLWAIARWMSGEPSDLLGAQPGVGRLPGRSRRATSTSAAPSWRPCWRRPVGATRCTVSSTARRRRTTGRRPRRRPRRGGHGAVRRRRPRRGARRAGRSPTPSPPMPTARSSTSTCAASWPSATCSNADIRRRWDDATMGPTHEQIRTRQPLAGRPPRTAGGRTGRARPGRGLHRLPAAVVGRARHPLARRPPPGRPAARRMAGEPGAGAGPGRAAPPRATAPGASARAAGDLLAHLPGVPHAAARDLGPRTARGGLRRRRPSPRPSCAGRAVADPARAAGRPRHAHPRPRHRAALARARRRPRGPGTSGCTLTYLRQLLEPERPTGEASFHLRADANAITLHASDHLVVDLWELRRLRGDADRSRERADIDRTITLLDAATAWWRGEPLADLAFVVGQEHEIERVRLLATRQPPRVERASPRARAGSECAASTPSGPRPRSLFGAGRTASPSPPPSAPTTSSGPDAATERALRHARQSSASSPSPPPRSCFATSRRQRRPDRTLAIETGARLRNLTYLSCRAFMCS